SMSFPGTMATRRVVCVPGAAAPGAVSPEGVLVAAHHSRAGIFCLVLGEDPPLHQLLERRGERLAMDGGRDQEVLGQARRVAGVEQLAPGRQAERLTHGAPAVQARDRQGERQVHMDALEDGAEVSSLAVKGITVE